MRARQPHLVLPLAPPRGRHAGGGPPRRPRLARGRGGPARDGLLGAHRRAASARRPRPRAVESHRRARTDRCRHPRPRLGRSRLAGLGGRPPRAAARHDAPQHRGAPACRRADPGAAAARARLGRAGRLHRQHPRLPRGDARAGPSGAPLRGEGGVPGPLPVVRASRGSGRLRRRHPGRLRAPERGRAPPDRRGRARPGHSRTDALGSTRPDLLRPLPRRSGRPPPARAGAPLRGSGPSARRGRRLLRSGAHLAG
ncbi:hypothetical protein ACH61_03232 [Rathayibacter tanaceti]|uniref:Uncharacterized protein n=1 Tax=Rathayibacter tanaceti TaxID=1671680 RepID=A0A166GZP8_9MICO|nr:hypothetical protein ACH61_03232 [Rathayibacter tanaceti]